MHEAAVAPRGPFLAGVVCVALLAAGCTMCPDPYDYSGPVPNGSAPQNDFQARSNGILPTGVNPRPFPPLVKAEPQPDPAAPAAPAAPDPATKPKLAEAEDDVLRLSAEEPASEEDANAAGQPAESPVSEVTAAPPAEPESKPEPDAWRERSGGDESVPAVATEPTLEETPGWRSRR